jgi:MFS family permease
LAFYFQAGVAALTATLGLLAIDKDTHHLDPSLDRRVDWIGAALVTAGLVLLTFALGDGETAKPHQWRSVYIIALLVVSVVLLAAFVWWEHVLEVGCSDPKEGEEGTWAPPLLKLSIFQRAHGKLAVMLCLVFFVWAGFSGWTFYAVVSSSLGRCVPIQKINPPHPHAALVSL